MADIKLNFSSQWQSLQVAKVIASPENEGESISYPYIKKIPHGLGYPPFCMGYGPNMGDESYSVMSGIDVDETYIYIEEILDCVVIYALDISKPCEYSNYTSEIGTVLEDTSGGILDLRKFLLHSRAVSPMILSVVTKNFTNTSLADTSMSYTHSLSYPIFQFGYQRYAQNTGVPGFIAGVWVAVPLAGQAWPVLNTNGFIASQQTSIIGGSYDGNFQWIPGTGIVATDIGTIITLRNPAIVTNNTVSVTI